MSDDRASLIMHWHDDKGKPMRYGAGNAGELVPRTTYRCPAHAIEKRPHAPHSTLTHNCKLTVDHEDGHACVCGKAWDRLEKVVSA